MRQGKGRGAEAADGKRRPYPGTTRSQLRRQARFSVVVEAVAEPLAKRITEIIPIPTIGIGASAACDGQVLVLGRYARAVARGVPKFVKRFGNLGTRH